MTPKHRWEAVAPHLVALLAAFVVTVTPAHAQVAKPFKIKGEGAGPSGLPLPGEAARPHWAIGEATHLGRYYGEGSVQTDKITVFDPAHGRIAGEFGAGSPFVFVAADGDRLVTWYGRTDHGASQPGSVELTVLGATAGGLIVRARWVAEFVAVPGDSTGRFAGVTGSWIMVAQSEPFVLGSDDPVAYSWEGQGTLTFRKPK